MVLLTQRKQLGLKIEAVEGTPETITSSELVTVLSPNPTINLNNVRRPVLRGTFSKLASLTGIQDAALSYQQEFAGNLAGDPTIAPAIGVSMKACGFREVDLYAVEIASFTGDRVVVGDILTGDNNASGTDTVRVMATMKKDTFDDAGGDKNTHADILFFEQLTGALTSSDTSLTCLNPNLAVGVSHSLAAPVLGLSSQTPTRVGTAYVPTSQKILRATGAITGTFTVGENVFQLIDTTSAATALDVAYGRVVATGGSGGSAYVDIQTYDSSFPFAIEAAPPADITGVDSGATQATTAVELVQGQSLTAKFFEDGISKTFAGCRGSNTFNLPTGGFPTMDVNLQGAYNAVADEANLSTGGATQAAVPTFLGTEFRVNRTWLPCASQITIDMGQTLVRRTCQNNAAGLEGFIITDRTPTLTMDPEQVQEIVSGAYTKAKNATTFDMQLRFGNFTSGSGVDAWLISMDVCQYEALNAGDRDGLITYDATVQINSYDSVEDAEIAICNYDRAVVDAI